MTVRALFPVGLVVISPVYKERFTLHPQHLDSKQFNCILKHCRFCEGEISDSSSYVALIRKSASQNGAEKGKEWWELDFGHSHCMHSLTESERGNLEEEGFSPCNLSSSAK